MEIQPIYLVPSSLYVSPGRHIVGKIKVEYERRINWLSFQPSIKNTGIKFEIESEKIGKVINMTSETILLTPEFLFGYIQRDPFAEWRYIVQEMVLTKDIEKEDFPKATKILSYDEATSISEECERMNIGDIKQISSLLVGENAHIIYITRVS